MSKIMYMDNEYAGFSLTSEFDTPETVTFPFTATSGGVLSATVAPSTSSTSYIYVVDNLSTSYRFASSGGLSYQMTIPIVKGRTYSISASSNYAINGTIKFYPFKSTPTTGTSIDLLATFTANNQTQTWAHSLTDYKEVHLLAYQNEFLLGTTTFFPNIEIPSHAIVAFYDGTQRKFQLTVTNTNGKTDYFTAMTRGVVYGIR